MNNNSFNEKQLSNNEFMRSFDRYNINNTQKINQHLLQQYLPDIMNYNYHQQANSHSNQERVMSFNIPALNFNRDVNINSAHPMNHISNNGSFNQRQSLGHFQQGMNHQLQHMYQPSSSMNNVMPQQTHNINSFNRTHFGQSGSFGPPIIPSVQTEAPKPTLLIPNINAVKKKPTADHADEKNVSTKYKKPNRIFIACTRCHKSKVRCSQLSDEEIAMLPEEHIKHMVQIMGVPNNISDPFNKSINKTSMKKGINYPCKRCYKSDKVCVYDHSRIGRGRKPKKMMQARVDVNEGSLDSSLNEKPNNLASTLESQIASSLESSTFKYVTEMKKQQEKLFEFEHKTKCDLQDYHLKEFMTISKTVADYLKLQLSRNSEAPEKESFKVVNESLNDENVKDKFDLIKMGLLTEDECFRLFELFRVEFLVLPQMKSLFDILFKMDWLTFKEKHPKLFNTIIAASLLVDKSPVDEGKVINEKSYLITRTVMQMLFYYGGKRKLRTVEMFMCVNVMIVCDTMGNIVKWDEYSDLMDIFKDYLNFIIETKVPIEEFVQGNIELSLDYDMNSLSIDDLALYRKTNDKKIDPLGNMLLTESKFLDLPCMAIILEMSAFHMDDAMNGSSANQLIAQISSVPVRDSTLHSYSEALRNSTSIYHQNLHIMANMTHLFMDIMDSNQKYKGKLFEDLKNTDFFDIVDSQVNSINAYVYLIPVDNKRLRLCLHSMKAQILECVTESLLLSYAKVKHDFKKTELFFKSIDDQTMQKIYETVKYSKDCIVELDGVHDDTLKYLPNCYLARLSVCFEMILKLIKFSLTNTKKFEDLISKVFEFSLRNVAMTYRCSDILKTYPSNFFVMRLQHLYTHAYMVLIEYINEGIQNGKFYINKSDEKLTKLLKQFDTCFKNNSHFKSKLAEHSDFFFKTLD